MRTEQKKENGWGSWTLIVILFALGVWPIALPLLFIKLFAPDNRQKETSAPPLRTAAAPAAQTAARSGTQNSKARDAAKRVVQSPVMRSSTARRLQVIGMLTALAGAFSMRDPLSALFWSSNWVELYLWDFLWAAAVAAAGAGLFFGGLSMKQAMNRYTRYLAVIGDQESVSLEELARKLGYSSGRVTKDLQKMIEKGYFGGQAYLNMELGYFFRSSQADADLSRKQRPAEQSDTAPAEAEEGYSGILRNIRRANDRIADPVLSEKVSRLEEITAKIFRAVEEDPKKRSRIDTFLNYYLPTTQKLLDSYAEFEATGIEGENLKQAKARIEKTMDSIVAGFEHQLDELYRADAMQVDSEVRVMETMLGRDTASVEKDFGLTEEQTSAPAGGAGIEARCGTVPAAEKEEGAAAVARQPTGE